jgi:hypothetical protein
MVVTKTVFRRKREDKKGFTFEEKEKEKVGKIQIVSSNGQETARICMKRIIKIDIAITVFASL